MAKFLLANIYIVHFFNTLQNDAMMPLVIFYTAFLILIEFIT